MNKSSKHGEKHLSGPEALKKDLCDGFKGLVGAKQFEKVKGISGKENSLIKSTEITVPLLFTKSVRHKAMCLGKFYNLPKVV